MGKLQIPLHLVVFSTLLLSLFGFSTAEQENKLVGLKTTSRALSFDGLWYGRYDGELRGTINGNTLTWGNGADSEVTYDSGNIHLGPFVGQITLEGLINWDDGDIWINYDFQAPTTPLPVECVDVWPTRRCEKKLGQGKCGNRKVAKNCEKTCSTCIEATTTPAPPPPTTAAPAPTRDPSEPRTVLWLGNSYTYGNDLPKMVQSLAQQDGKSIQYDQHTNGGWTWEKHATSATTINKINSQKWDVVILQEQSQRPAFGEAQVCRETVAPLESLMEVIRANNPDTVAQLYGTWGRPGVDEFDQWQYYLTQRYYVFACMVSAPARMAPVGEGFKTMEELHGSEARLALYKPNDHHASKQGTYLAACIHFLAIYGEGTSVLGNSYTAGLDANTAKTIQEVAETVWNNGVDWDHATDDECQYSMC